MNVPNPSISIQHFFDQEDICRKCYDEIVAVCKQWELDNNSDLTTKTYICVWCVEPVDYYGGAGWNFDININLNYPDLIKKVMEKILEYKDLLKSK